jgi:hypothetical protein
LTRFHIGALLLSGLAAISAPQAARASAVAIGAGHSPNYTFPDGVVGFHLYTSGGPINPGVAVGFNPQPDPPGAPAPFLDLSNPFDAKVFQMGDGSVFKFELTFAGLPGIDAGLLLPAVQKPDSDGKTGFRLVLGDGSVLVADLTFSGPGGVASWVSFNPQPDPPGDFVAYVVGMGDASVNLQLSVNGDPLSFTVPEPSTWAMMSVAFATLGGLAWRRRKAAPAIAT